jgi:hypothetical protein
MAATANANKKDTYPHPVISPIAEGTNRPTYASLLLAQTQINANAKSVHSSDGTGVHGHLVLTMAPPEFLEMTNNVAHEAPDFPGRAPIYPGNATAHQRSEISDLFKADVVSFQIYHDTDNTLRSQLIAACPDTFIRALKVPKLGYSNVTTLALLTHLWTTYGTIKMEDLEANQVRMVQQWHPSSPIEDLWTQIDEAAEFAILGESPYDDKFLLRAAYKNIEATGVFTADCRDWNIKPDAEKTFANLRTFFAEADLRRDTTTASAGFHTANVVASNAGAPVTMADIEQLLKKAIAQDRKTYRAPNTVMAPAPASTTTAPGDLTYCWTHGLSKNKKHDGYTCENKAQGHQDAATANNKMGGSERVYTDADKRPRAGK